MFKPQLFIGSSSEALEIAQAIKKELRDVTEPVLWTDDLFLPGRYVLEVLEEQANRFRFAVLVATPDDFLIKRRAESSAMRDNVLFELGLFVGTTGRNRAFLVVPKSGDLHIPSDLHGVILAEYDDSLGLDGCQIDEVVHEPCRIIKKAVQVEVERIKTATQQEQSRIEKRREIEEIAKLYRVATELHDVVNEVQKEIARWLDLDIGLDSREHHNWKYMIRKRESNLFREYHRWYPGAEGPFRRGLKIDPRTGRVEDWYPSFVADFHLRFAFACDQARDIALANLERVKSKYVESACVAGVEPEFEKVVDSVKTALEQLILQVNCFKPDDFRKLDEWASISESRLKESGYIPFHSSLTRGWLAGLLEASCWVSDIAYQITYWWNHHSRTFLEASEDFRRALVRRQTTITIEALNGLSIEPSDINRTANDTEQGHSADARTSRG